MTDKAEWHFVQNEIRESDREAVTQFGRLNTHFDQIGFCDAAALISCLDLIVTVDTSVAHLAAAMGKPTWILLVFASDWRWGICARTASGIRAFACSASPISATGARYLKG